MTGDKVFNVMSDHRVLNLLLGNIFLIGRSTFEIRQEFLWLMGEFFELYSLSRVFLKKFIYFNLINYYLFKYKI